MNPLPGCAPALVLAYLVLVSVGCRAVGGGEGGDWEVLFDGDPAQLEENFKGYRRDEVPEGWAVEDGAIALVSPGTGDLVTRESFASFELELEWRIAPRGNSGIMFHVSEDERFGATYSTGPEMQILDNAVFDGDVQPLHMAGANYALHAPPRDATRPVGEWNAVRILVDGAHVEYWLNGEQQCEYELGSDAWRALVRASKFDAMEGYGVQGEGKLALQDHGGPVWFRNVRVRRLD